MIYRDNEIADDVVIRNFIESIDPIELKWHRDDEDRTIVSINETNWLIQLENKLPQSLNSPIFIARGEWHRVIKGTGELNVKIIKSDGFYK
ncbi:hypothetical protein UFOVP1247_298 [uncultured Caudovirales phage]|uniref:Uncharacterized protein n=1 Tax=uncultured Caudovirales phage TaxID=2100421 RepID=A0A6J5Q808_9CAUD|nr:hypothetical protein UFOVP970_338 [uncultured Caudovirales phage]CAB4193927.1 hypothetical protein UFOVP1247_298 [uncultured Caudovirales phage]